MKEIIVHTQEELDAISKDCKDRIIIKSENEIVVSNRYYYDVTAYDSANVKAYDSANVTACGNCQVLNMSYNSKINVSGNARIVCLPKTANEFIDYYDIKHTDGKATLYKAVHKSETGYFANHNRDFTYHIGKTIKEKCDSNVNVECSSGIHVAYLDWALCFGEDFDDLAILEVTTDIDKIVVPKNSNGKVRTSEVYVVREVPLEECGVLGSMIARRMK